MVYQLLDIEDAFSSQSSLDQVRPNHWTDRSGLPVALNPRTEFVEIFRAGLLDDAPQRPYLDLVVQRHRESTRV
jgi:hypothetical protein